MQQRPISSELTTDISIAIEFEVVTGSFTFLRKTHKVRHLGPLTGPFL